MRCAAVPLVLALSCVGAAAFAAPAKESAPPAQPPLTMENAKPVAVPAPPRLKAQGLPPAPKALETPDLMAVPETPNLAAPPPVAAPINPVGAPPPPPRRTAPAVAAPVAPNPASVEERVSGAAPKPPASERTAVAAPPPPPLPRATALTFPAGSAILPEAGEGLLTTVAEHMRIVATRRLQLRAYAFDGVDSERHARQLSLARALAVRERLTALGVRSTRIDVRPLGNALPPTEPDARDRVDIEFTSE